MERRLADHTGGADAAYLLVPIVPPTIWVQLPPNGLPHGSERSTETSPTP